MKYQVWYMKPAFFRDGILGEKLPDAANLSCTHVHLKDVEADGLDGVWQAMQAEHWSPNGEAYELIKCKGLEHTSMSIGDVIVDETSSAHIVSTIGFQLIGDKRGWKEHALAATRGTQLGAILCAATKTETPAPCFTSKASVTSDGFLVANYTGADGRQHMGAFIGPASDLVRNAQGLADHLKLDETARAELYRVLLKWIELDYSRGALKALKMEVK